MICSTRSDDIFIAAAICTPATVLHSVPINISLLMHAEQFYCANTNLPRDCIVVLASFVPSTASF